MPATSPPVAPTSAAQLNALGGCIRAQRRHQKVTVSAAAEAAGLSRVTLHRIERGEPSVTMGAYLNALAAVGLELNLIDPQARAMAADKLPMLQVVQAGDFPELKRLAWQRPGLTALTPAEALNLYERNWRHVAAADLLPRERELIQTLVATVGGGRLLV